LGQALTAINETVTLASGIEYCQCQHPHAKTNTEE